MTSNLLQLDALVAVVVVVVLVLVISVLIVVDFLAVVVRTYFFRYFHFFISSLFQFFFNHFQSIIRPLWREKKAQSPHTFSSEERAEIIFDNVVREQSLTAPSNKTDTSKKIEESLY